MHDSHEPKISIVIPVYNEEAILRASVVDLVDRLDPTGWNYEIILAENGSTDRTAALCLELSQRFPRLRSIHTPEPNYGEALRAGIFDARGEIVICDEVDLCDTDFYERALTLLDDPSIDLVVGSKTIAGARDERPRYRRAGTRVINGLLRVSLGFQGTDTHGLKAFRREPMSAIAEACLIDRDLFASELVIRAERAGLNRREIPVHVLEKRPPSVGLAKRVPHVLTNLVKLFVAIRVKN